MAGNNIIVTTVAENNIIVTATINGQTIDIQVPSVVSVEITPNPLPYVQQNSDWDSISGVTEILNKPVLGTASALDVPVTGNASPTQVVLGSDTRLVPLGGGVTSVTATSPILSSGGVTPDISIPAATSLVDGYATSTQILKLDGIQSGAEVNVNADWNSVSGDSEILNKPNIPTQYTDELAQDAVGSILTNTSNVQFVYDDATPKITASVDLSGKQDVLGFTPVPDTRTVNGHALSGDVTVSKSDVGLSNVDNTSDTNKPISSATQTALDGKVDENLAITGATNTKITFDSKGLVTSGTDATTSDIADSTNKRYVTDANLIAIGNQSGTNTGDITLGTASGLSLFSQQLSLGLASSGVTGALSGTDWSTFNNKVSLTGDETVAGIKTFSSFSVTPSALPTLDYQVSNKIYTDTKVPYTVLTDTKDPTGWADPAAVEAAMTYDSATQTISISGTHYYYWRGVKSSVTNFVSTPHANVVGSIYFLFSVDGVNFTWDILPWSFDVIMLASVNYQTAYKYATSEPHGLMPWEAHEEFHRTIGTYKESGGTLDATTYTLASTTAANRRPNVFQAIVHDEDIEHTLVTLTSKLYNKFFLSSTGVANFTGETADIIPLLGNNPYYNSFTTPNWTQTLMPNNSYSCVWLVGQPVTQDANSQSFRYFWVQGQSQGSLATMQGLNPGDVSFGTLSSQVEEFVFLVKIIVRYTGGNWVLTSVTNLNGNRFIQTGTIAGTYLSTVTIDGTLTGDGSTGNPLSTSSGATTVTAVGTTTLTVSSATIQEFTGTTTQIVVLPVVTTLRLGHQFTIANHSTGSITLNSSGGNLVGTITAGNTLVVRCILLTGTTAASWDSDYLVQPTEYVGNGTGNFVRTTSPTLVTPSLGVATATTINGNTISAGTGTLSLSTFTLTLPESMTVAGRNVENIFFQTQDITVSQVGGGIGFFEKALNVKLNTTSGYNSTMSAIEVENNFTGDAGGLASSVYGIHVKSGNNGVGFANHIIGIKIEEPTNLGVIAGNMWGLYLIQPQTSSVSGNSAIHIEGINGAISFAGNSSGTLASKIFSPSSASLTIQATTLTLTATTATASGTLGVSGNGAFGQSLDANVRLAVTKSAPINIGAAQRGLYVQISSSGTGTFTDNVMGAFYQSNHAGSGNAGTVIGGQFATGKTGTGNLTTASGMRLQQSNSNATGIITNSYAIEILSPTVTGVITNNYGIYINAQTGGGTLNYSIYTGQATNGARFGHQIIINGSTDVIQSRILANATQTANIATWESSAGAVLASISGTGVFTSSNFTGGGTLATGGFTLTVPATGTTPLLGIVNTFSTDQRINGKLGIDRAATSSLSVGADTGTNYADLHGDNMGFMLRVGTGYNAGFGTPTALLGGGGNSNIIIGTYSGELRFMAGAIQWGNITAGGLFGFNTLAPLGKFHMQQSTSTYMGGLHFASPTNADGTWAWTTGTDTSLYYGFASAASGADAEGDFTSVIRLHSTEGLTSYTSIRAVGLIFPTQATTAGAPTYVLGGIYFDTTLNKLMIGGATAWEEVTSS